MSTAGVDEEKTAECEVVFCLLYASIFERGSLSRYVRHVTRCRVMALRVYKVVTACALQASRHDTTNGVKIQHALR